MSHIVFAIFIGGCLWQPQSQAAADIMIQRLLGTNTSDWHAPLGTQLQKDGYSSYAIQTTTQFLDSCMILGQLDIATQ